MVASKETLKEMALESAILYCESNGFDVEKLKAQDYYHMGKVGYFMQDSDVKPYGLTNDMATMPIPTLMYTYETQTITPTEHTDKYLR